MKNKKYILIMALMVIMILIVATVFSIMKFSVINPFSSCFGMLQILFTDKPYTVVQTYPCKVVFSKTADTYNKSSKELLDAYMKDRGYYELPDEQKGADLVYTNGLENDVIYFTTNAFYSKWIWSVEW